MQVEEILDEISNNKAMIAVNAPAGINQGLMRDDVFRRSLSSPPRQGRFTDIRVVDYELIQRGIKTVRVPDDIKKCPLWVRKGILLFDTLQKNGFLHLSTETENRYVFEVNSEAIFWSLLGFSPYDAKSLEGRIQRQLVLFEKGVEIEDPMEFFQEITRYRLLKGAIPLTMIFGISELYALAGAYMAWYKKKNPKSVFQLGNSQEGLIYLPCQGVKL